MATLVGHLQRRDRARLVDLLDGHGPGRDRLVGEQVVQPAGVRAGVEERKDREALVADRLADANRVKGGNLTHDVLLRRQQGA